MKRTEYHCDGRDCKSIATNEETPTGWIEIGSSDGISLKITNRLENAMVTSVTKYSDMHFCSIKCLTDRLVAS